MGTYDITDPFVTDFKSRTKPIYSNSNLPSFSLKGSWSGNKWQNSKISFDLSQEDTYKNKLVKQVKGNKLVLGIENKPSKIGVMLKTDNGDVWMNKKTLKKGTNTILGMNQQIDRDGYLVRGDNYANPWYPTNEYIKSVSLEKLKENKKKAAQKKLKIELDKIGVSSIYNVDIESEKDKIAKGQLDARLEKISKARHNVRFSNFKANVNVGTANTIRSDLGLSPIEMKRRTRRKGRYATDHGVFDSMGKLISSTTSGDFLTDHYRKEAVVDWAKGYGLKLTEDDKGTFRTGSYQEAIFWTHNNNRRRVGTKVIQTYATRKPTNKAEKTIVLFKKVESKRLRNEALYQKYYNPITSDDDKKLEKLSKLIAGGPPRSTPIPVRSRMSNASKQKIHANHEAAMKIYNLNVEKHDKLSKKIKDNKLEYYTISDNDFTLYETYKQNLISHIGRRRSNQKFIIDDLKLDTKTIEQQDRSDHIIPTLEATDIKLDTKASILKDQVDDYNWQQKISQNIFGTDKIPGESHITAVLSSYDGTVRGGDYYSQDVGKLIKKTKVYETALESQIKQKTDDISNISIDKTEGLVDVYSDKAEKEYIIADKDYLTKSLKMTRDEREQLEQNKKEQDYYSLRNAHIPNISVSQRHSRNPSKPTLKSYSRKSGSNDRRTKAGKNTLGGLVI